MKNVDVIVIGGGHNGLTTANFLAKRGKSVLVLEKQSQLGGTAAQREFHPGFASGGVLFDTSLVRQETLQELNGEFEFNQSAPPIYIPDPKGPGINLYFDAKLSYPEIAAYSEKDAKKYIEFRSFIERVSKPIRTFLTTVPAHFEKMTMGEKFHLFKTSLSLRRLGKKDMMEFLRIPPMCVADWLNEWFETDILKAALALDAVNKTFAGPWSPGTALNLLFQESMRETGLKHGPLGLINALEKSARKNKVEIRTNCQVQEVIIEDGSAKGVLLENGEKILADTVFSALDPKNLFHQLIRPEHLNFKLEENVNHFRGRGSLAILNLAIEGYLKFINRPQLLIEHARLVSDLDHLEKAFDCLKYKQASNSFALELFVPSVTNPQLAVSGHSVISLAIHFVPYDLNSESTLQTKQVVEQEVIAQLKSFTQDFNVIASEILFPKDLEQKYSLTQGHLFHGEHSIDQLMVRPFPECARYETPIKRLHLCGSGSFPGGNLTCLPGKLAADSL